MSRSLPFTHLKETTDHNTPFTCHGLFRSFWYFEAIYKISCFYDFVFIIQDIRWCKVNKQKLTYSNNFVTNTLIMLFKISFENVDIWQVCNSTLLIYMKSKHGLMFLIWTCSDHWWSLWSLFVLMLIMIIIISKKKNCLNYGPLRLKKF